MSVKIECGKLKHRIKHQKGEFRWEAREQIISVGMNILWELPNYLACARKIRIHKWDAAL